MAVSIDIRYEGELHCRATHGPSGQEFITDAPVDNGGRGEAFSPTDLVATALGACTLTIMGIVAKRQNIDISGTRVNVIKEMAAEPVRRIGALRVCVEFPPGLALSNENRQRLEGCAAACPVKKSLHPDVQVMVEYKYA